MITPIYSRLKEYLETSTRFHTPGHSGMNIDDVLYKSASMDITELSFSDNLSCPTGIINQAEELMAMQYGVSYALFLTNGGSGGVFIALSIIKEYGNRIIIGEDAHVSIFRAAKLLDIECIVVDNKDIIDACETKSDITAVIVTTPNYYGMVYNCDRLQAYLKDKGIIYVLDHSHGMHYVYSDRLPDSMAAKADIAVGSLHKTLPVMTGGAILTVNQEEYYKLALYHRMNLHTTSPSYTIMASMDFARGYMASLGQGLYRKLYNQIDTIEDKLYGSKYSIVRNDDYTRLVIHCQDMNGYSVMRELEKRGAFAEMADNNHVVFILTPFNMDKIAHLAEALIGIDTSDKPVEIPYYLPTQSEGIVDRGVTFIPIEQSIGRISRSEIAIYPPGIPLLRSGDIIDERAVDIMLSNRKCLIGLVKGLVPVIK